MCSTATLIGIASLFPTFIRVLTIENDAKNAAAVIAEKPDDNNLKSIQQSVIYSLVLLDSLKIDQNSTKISDLINGVVSIRKGVRFTNFTATKISTTTFSMNIQGISPTRNVLLAFKNSFENLSPNNKIDLPVSELAKSSNVSFTLQLKEKLP